jgi:hypothetical protein
MLDGLPPLTIVEELDELVHLAVSDDVEMGPELPRREREG